MSAMIFYYVQFGTVYYFALFAFAELLILPGMWKKVLAVLEMYILCVVQRLMLSSHVQLESVGVRFSLPT